MSTIFNEKMSENNGNLEFTLIEEEPIIGFNMWGEKRICLPQLLRFVLSEFDIDVIDRAVTDLQINCFQCNLEQIKLLHVNHIVPKDIEKCGLIRKSDAERLCKYLLQPKNNLNKSIDAKEFSQYQSIQVMHTCFGEQRGILYPTVYTASDAKCIKCLSCENFFKTFEFVGHTHKLDEVSKTCHWGFDSNNWRLLLQIFADDETLNIIDLNEAKAILDRVKTMFYEEELKKILSMNKSCNNIIWRPTRKLKFPSPSKPKIFSIKPSHLKDGPVDFYKKSMNLGLNNLGSDDLFNSGFVPNVYLNSQENITSSAESIVDDDDVEDFDEIVDKSAKSFDDVALNVALQIKREVMPKDTISLGTISTYQNKKIEPALNTNYATKHLKPNHSPLVVAQAHTSIPPQFLMLEALWSQLFRDIIQLTHLVPFKSNDERNRLVGQLIRCQDLFRSQWTNLAEENQGLKENLAQEQSQRRDMEIIRDKMAISLKELTMEKESLAEIVKQLESKCEQLQSQIDVNCIETRETSICCDDDYPQLEIESLDQSIMDNTSRRMTFKRHIDNNHRTIDLDDDDNAIKQIRLNDGTGNNYNRYKMTVRSSPSDDSSE